MAKKSRPSMLNTLWQPRAKAKKRTAAKSRRLPRAFESLEPRNLLAVTTFQEGVGGYAGTQDTVLYSISPTVNFGAETGISVDQQDVAGVRQGLLQFANIFGSGSGQVPLGSTITSATITFSVFNDSNAAMQMSFYRMNVGWDQSTATWSSFGSIGGVQASEGEAEGLPPDGVQYDATTGTKVVDVTTSLRHWATGESNFGWLIESAATNGWDFNTSEAAQANRPILTVNYTPPAGAGQFQFLNLLPSHTEGDAGTSNATLQIARIGGTNGAASVDYTIAAGGATPATAGADFVAAGPITVNFADGQSVASISVTINGDTILEGFETLTVTLSNATGGATVSGSAGVATLTIGDDDALINEVLANITNATTDETDREYIELIGTPGASLDGYFFVVFEGEGEEEENAGAGSGIADLVVDLAGQTFGANGLLVITPTNWAYQSLKDAQTNQLKTARLDGVGGRIEDSSQTYALIRSATPIVEGTDYDTVGAYASDLATASSSNDLNGVREGVGILDTGPFAPGGGAQMVDSVGVVEGGGNDRDRVLTTREANHPGIHVHQPDGFGTDASVASDAVSRRQGQKTPNSIGVWFNGDIPNGTATPIAYPAGTANNRTPVSVTAPAGAVITPGSLNILRNVFLTVAATSVDESAGTVTLTVNRSGDASQAITVGYHTIDGTAKAGLDYANSAGQLNFAIGDSSEDIVIPILTDSVAEGFESFTVQITSPTAPFLVTVSTARVTINDGDVLVKTFQQGDANGYAGTRDTVLNSIQPTDAFGIASTVVVDEQAGTLTGTDARPTQGLLKFADIFGAAASQIPVGSQIFSGFLTLNVLNPTGADAAVRFFRMLQDWDETTATWSDPQGSLGAALVNGVTPDDVEASVEADFVPLPGASGLVEIPIDRDTLQAWANGSLPNFGWSIVSNSGNDWSFASSDGLSEIAPKLTILYTDPTATAGTFGFSDADYKVNEGGAATITVHRVGGSTGAAAVDWALSVGTAQLADVTGPTSGTVNFAAGELFKSFTVATFNDNVLEANETVNLTLSGAGLSLDPEKTVASLLIRDNDFSATSPAVLLSEILINSPGLDSGVEYAELVGTAGAGLGSLYFVVINGDVGEGEGSTDLVVDLGAFANGANGTTIITALNNWGFAVHSGTTQIALAALDSEIIANDTATYALVYSPLSRLHVGAFDYDWDNDGSLDLPVGAVIVDSVGNKDNGALDQTYGPAANVVLSAAHPNLFVADGISRLRGNTLRNNASAWFRGDLTTTFSTADDQLVYDAVNAFGLPVAGAAMTPGEINTGTAVDSPLVSLTGITPNAPVGTVTLTFNGPVSQFLDQGGFIGVSISDASGGAIPGVDSKPAVAGLETNALTLSFTGSAVIGGKLPAGNYQLNFTGNSLIGNGRAVDAANTATATGSNFEFEFTVTASPGMVGDYDGSGQVDGHDFLSWQRQLGSPAVPSGSGADGNKSGTVDGPDLGVWAANFGAPGAIEAAVPAAPVVAAAPAEGALPLDPALVDLAMAASGFRPSARAAAGQSASAYRPMLLAARQTAIVTHTALALVFEDDGYNLAATRGQYRPVDDLFAEIEELGSPLRRAL